MTSVLRHLVKARPGWVIDYQADEGRHSAAIGIVRNAFHYGQADPASYYDRECDIVLYETFANWPDRPNTRVTSCLHERFGLPWDPECARYQINVTDKASDDAWHWLVSTPAQKTPRGKIVAFGPKLNAVAVQYQGDSSKDRKDLTHDQAFAVCMAILNAGRVPILFDWRNQSPLVNQTSIFSPGRLPQRDEWGRDAQMNAALITWCEAFVGIDSGPGKCASATETPTLITWTGHHPAMFHDPAPNTTHLVPEGYEGLEPVCGSGSLAFFEENYKVRRYERDPAKEIVKWLGEVLV